MRGEGLEPRGCARADADPDAIKRASRVRSVDFACALSLRRPSSRARERRAVARAPARRRARAARRRAGRKRPDRTADVRVARGDGPRTRGGGRRRRRGRSGRRSVTPGDDPDAGDVPYQRYSAVALFDALRALGSRDAPADRRRRVHGGAGDGGAGTGQSATRARTSSSCDACA